jgi:AbrB family looped-hinge helix DNA binding protein
VPYVRVGPRHQITIPQAVREAAGIDAGDLLEIVTQRGKVVISPQQVVAKPVAPKLSQEEQDALLSARRKINTIQQDMLNSAGLTRLEADAAVKVGLIAVDQRWWWLEEWQEGEREAERDTNEGRLSGPFESADELLAHLHKHTA